MCVPVSFLITLLISFCQILHFVKEIKCVVISGELQDWLRNSTIAIGLVTIIIIKLTLLYQIRKINCDRP